MNSSICENYLDFLDSCSAARKNNLIHLKYSIDKEENFKTKFSLLRSSLPILYSHYEGFLRDCFFKLMEILISFDNNHDLYLLIFNIVTEIDDGIRKQATKINKLLSLFEKLLINNNYLYGLDINKYQFGFDEIDTTFKILKLENPYKNYRNYSELNEICMRHRIDPLVQIKQLYNARCEISHGNLAVKQREIYSLKPTRGVTQNQVDNAYDDWCINYLFILHSIDAYKKTFYIYLKEFIQKD